MIARVTRFSIIQNTIDEAMSTMHATVLPELEKVEALIACVVTYNSENGVGVATAVYESAEAADAAQDIVQEVWKTMGQYMSEPPVKETNDVLYVYSR